MPEIENQIIEKSKRTISRSVAEGESATNADIIEEFYNLTKFTTKWSAYVGAWLWRISGSTWVQ